MPRWTGQNDASADDFEFIGFKKPIVVGRYRHNYHQEYTFSLDPKITQNIVTPSQMLERVEIYPVAMYISEIQWNGL